MLKQSKEPQTFFTPQQETRERSDSLVKRSELIEADWTCTIKEVVLDADLTHVTMISFQGKQTRLSITEREFVEPEYN